ncbi:PASTA domain-containing protein [Catellatospora sp. NPDC049609]|uniref:PASTA domain-containing protein n=1 Tax=Catellatospora sp. NPDC049609 TaxID=3155505 RepID=UPI00341E0F42
MRRTGSRAALAAALMCAGLLSACAARVPAGEVPALPSPPSGPTARVPELTNKHVDLVEKEFPAAGLVALIRYEPGLLLEAGTVAVTDPPPGTIAPAGSVVRVVVAGAPKNLDDYIRGNHEVFLGAGLSSDGTLVLSVYQKGAEAGAVIEGARKYITAKQYRVVSCPRSRVELEQVQIELSRREFLPRAGELKFSTQVDPASCALRLSADLTDDETEQLMKRFEGALVIERGSGAGYGVRT